MDLNDVTVIIPALNEEQALPLVLHDLPTAGRIIVVDNGSTDATAEVASRFGVLVAYEPRRGYGSACLRGLRTIEERISAGDPPPHIVVFIDADHSDHAECLPQLVAAIKDGKADFVLGSRLLGERERGALPPAALFGNRLACFLMRLLFRAKYTDLGPFRAIRYDRLCELEMCDTNYGWTIEMQIKAARAGLRWLEIPVAYRRRVGRSKISGTVTGVVGAGSKILWTIARYGLNRSHSLSGTKSRRKDSLDT